MKSKLIIALLLFAGLAACKKSDVKPFHSQGVLTGYDVLECFTIPCGGIFVTINSDTAGNPPRHFHINSTLARLGISENTPFPINVSLNWKPDTGIWGRGGYIAVSDVKVIK